MAIFRIYTVLVEGASRQKLASQLNRTRLTSGPQLALLSRGANFRASVSHVEEEGGGGYLRAAACHVEEGG